MNSVTFDSAELNDIFKLIKNEHTRREAKELADITLDPSSYEDGKLTVKALTKMKSVHDLYAKSISTALKTAINSIYGLTSAKFDNKFKDPRNVDNIVAKLGEKN